MRGAILLLPPCTFMAWCLVKHRDNFTFTFNLFKGAHTFTNTCIGRIMTDPSQPQTVIFSGILIQNLKLC
jgi:hypothetical protein